MSEKLARGKPMNPSEIAERAAREKFEKDLHQECRIIEAEIAAAKRYTDGVQIIFNFAKQIRERAIEESRVQLLQPLKDACDRDWKDETPEQIVAIAANAIHWRHIDCCEGTPKVEDAMPVADPPKGNENV